jgi:hypothetical protein
MCCQSGAEWVHDLHHMIHHMTYTFTTCAASLVRNGYSVNADGTPKNRIGIELPSGQLLITKVFLARCSAEKGNDGKEGGEDGGDAGAPPLMEKSQVRQQSCGTAKRALSTRENRQKSPVNP